MRSSPFSLPPKVTEIYEEQAPPSPLPPSRDRENTSSFFVEDPFSLWSAPFSPLPLSGSFFFLSNPPTHARPPFRLSFLPRNSLIEKENGSLPPFLLFLRFSFASLRGKVLFPFSESREDSFPLSKALGGTPTSRFFPSYFLHGVNKVPPLGLLGKVGRFYAFVLRIKECAILLLKGKTVAIRPSPPVRGEIRSFVTRYRRPPPFSGCGTTFPSCWCRRDLLPSLFPLSLSVSLSSTIQKFPSPFRRAKPPSLDAFLLAASRTRPPSLVNVKRPSSSFPLSAFPFRE